MAVASPNEYTPQQYQAAARKWAEKLGLMEWWPVIDWIAINESGWQGIQSSVLDPKGPGGRENSWGPFQLLIGGVGQDKTPAELLEPETNAEMALRYIKEGDYGLDKGYGINAATHAWTVTHGVDMEWVNTHPGQSPAPGRAGTPAAPAPAPAGAGGVEPDRSDPKYTFTAEQVDPGGIYEGVGQVGGFNYALFRSDTDDWRLATTPAPGDDATLIDYMDLAIDLWATQLAGGQLEVAQANVELGKKLDALTQGRTMYQELVPYSLPEGTEFIPGGGPGGVYEKLGLGVMPAETTRMNPFALAMAMMGKTPEMGAGPEMGEEGLLAMARRMMGAAGAGEEAAPPAAPSTFQQALTPTPSISPAPALPVAPAVPAPTTPIQESVIPPRNPQEGDIWVRVAPPGRFVWFYNRWVQAGPQPTRDGEPGGMQ